MDQKQGPKIVCRKSSGDKHKKSNKSEKRRKKSKKQSPQLSIQDNRKGNSGDSPAKVVESLPENRLEVTSQTVDDCNGNSPSSVTSSPPRTHQLLSARLPSLSETFTPRATKFINKTESTFSTKSLPAQLSVRSDYSQLPNKNSSSVDDIIATPLSALTIGRNINKCQRNKVLKTMKNNSLSVSDYNQVKAKYINESLRWEGVLEDPDQERERLKIYKMNRRKRYLAAAQAKGLGWVSEYLNNGMPRSEEAAARDTKLDFGPIKGLGPLPQTLSNSTLFEC